MKSLISEYQKTNPEKFNMNFIKSKNKENLIDIISDIFKSVEIIDGVKFLGARLLTDESNFLQPLDINGVKEERTDRSTKPVLPSRFDKIVFRVRLEHKTKDKEGNEIIDSHEQDYELLVNKLIDNKFYINEGVRYYPIYQIIDSATYAVKNGISLRALTMPITLKNYKTRVIEDIYGEKYTGDEFILHLFSKKVNPMYYYLAKFGLYGTFDYFGLNKDKIEFFEEEPEQEEGYTIFRANSKLFAKVDKKIFEHSYYSNIFIMVFNIFNTKSNYELVMTEEYWLKKLGHWFVKNPSTKKSKAEGIIISLERLVDDSTRKILRINDSDKEDTYTIVRYMLKYFDELHQMDNMDLSNKRIRVYEYQLYPLRYYLSRHIFRVLNSPSKTIKTLKRIFSGIGSSPMFLVRHMVNNELLRYYNSSNEINLFGSSLRYTFRGPQSISKTISVDQRDIHPSYVGKLSLIASSAGDPGTSGTLTPFAKEYNYYFTEHSNMPGVDIKEDE
jgi:hypothetical protein